MKMLANTCFVDSVYPQKAWLSNIVFGHTEGSRAH